MQYYMHINGQQVGPFDESLLMLNGLTPTTPVWADGMTGWMPANQSMVHHSTLNHRAIVQCHPQIWCGAFWSPSSAVCHSASSAS